MTLHSQSGFFTALSSNCWSVGLRLAPLGTSLPGSTRASIFLPQSHKAWSTELGGALGIALLGSIVTFIYRGTITRALGADLPPDALAAARDTLGGALSVVEALPEELGAALIKISRGAFVDAIQTTAMVSAALALIAAAATAQVLGRRSHQL